MQRNKFTKKRTQANVLLESQESDSYEYKHASEQSIHEKKIEWQ